MYIHCTYIANICYINSENILKIDVIYIVRLDINSIAVIQFAAKLETIGKADLPVAVRSALNDAAYDLKTRTMPKSAKRFTNRSPNFFKANSKYEKATGLKIFEMKSTVGFVSETLKGKSNFAVKDLEQQEKGGKIAGKSFIPMNQARRGGSKTQSVKPNSRTTALTNIVHAKKMQGKHDRQKFVKAVHKAKKGGLVMGNRDPKVLWRVLSISGTGGTKYRLSPIYSYKENRKVSVDKTNFMKDASIRSGETLEAFFMIQAKKRIFK